MDGWLGGCVSLFFTARAPVVGDDAGKMWEEVGRDKPAYSTIERLLSPLRRRRVREEWSAREVAVFEVGMCRQPKDFAAISRAIGSKTTNQVVEFYYTAWKHSQHYWRWKQTAAAAQPERSQPRVEIVLDDESAEEREQQAVVPARPSTNAQPMSPTSALSAVVSTAPPAASAARVDSVVDVVVARGSPHSALMRAEEQTARIDEKPEPALQQSPLSAEGDKG